MRKVLVILALTAAAITANANDAFAQRRGGGYGGGYGGNRGGSGWGITLGGGGIGVYSGSNYGRGYNTPYNSYGSYYNSYGSPYYSNGIRYYSSPSYYGTEYYYSNPVVQVPATEIRQSFYPEPVISQQSATVVVLLPRADAQVWFDGAATSQSGMERSFVSPALEAGTYTYTIRARWMENGQSFERERKVNVQRGQSFTVNFRGDSGESLRNPPLPK